MKKIIYIGLLALPFFFTACGESTAAEEIGTEEIIVEEEQEEVEVKITKYTVDTEKTIINWSNFELGEIDHSGTVKALTGEFEIKEVGNDISITKASLFLDMNTISEGNPKLEKHLKNEDFFDINNFASTEFTFDRHENEMIYGTISIIGKQLQVEAPVSIGKANKTITIEIGDFKLDFSKLEMPFFLEDIKEAIEDQHDPMIGFSATIVGE